MYGFLLRPRWLAFHAVVIAGIVLMVNLGFWQLRRLDERQAFNATVEARADLPPEPLDDVLAEADDVDLLEWRQVEVSGTYLADEQVTVVNRSQGGAAGDLAVVPLELADGRLLIVDRGFVPLGADAAPAPTGDVDLVGRLHPSQERRRGQLTDVEGDLDQMQRIDLERLGEQLPAPVVPMYVDLVSSVPADGPFPAPVEVPDLAEGPHLSYAAQWFIFSACVGVGWVLAVRRSAATRRQEAARAPTAQPPVTTAV